jgi:glycerol-3-phosphate dehydrogenase
MECAERFGVDVPIISQIRRLLDGQASGAGVLASLLSREPRPE